MAITTDARLLAAVLPIAAAVLSRRRQDADEQLLVPVAVMQYLESMNADRWYDASILRSVVADALADGPAASLLAVQGWVLRFAWNHLGHWHARRLYEVRKMNMHDQVTAELAARELLDIDADTLHRWWIGPHELWVDRWRVAGTRDPDVLEHARLYSLEIEFLDREA